ncbi:hypothetical protein F6R98_03970 [Candidatus Methylospira mobilis]|uniref:Uncharacterized protein n=1 Tax=Candidatus Methylospira mobilis TaxID=1808979 RepID=A0A5Q0BDC6_9GAMM|nr:hypothetical protein [Candidatus Methylospira mobilis]QFY41893.1 hypothetical protein F6R98_03970 [Candidatus Methylospira mobilis]
MYFIRQHWFDSGFIRSFPVAAFILLHQLAPLDKLLWPSLNFFIFTSIRGVTGIALSAVLNYAGILKIIDLLKRRTAAMFSLRVRYRLGNDRDSSGADLPPTFRHKTIFPQPSCNPL